VDGLLLEPPPWLDPPRLHVERPVTAAGRRRGRSR
jgi:hypothetical protein